MGFARTALVHRNMWCVERKDKMWRDEDPLIPGQLPMVNTHGLNTAATLLLTNLVSKQVSLSSMNHSSKLIKSKEGIMVTSNL